jgi:tetratricopeptide (TPR) repeat protein
MRRTLAILLAIVQIGVIGVGMPQRSASAAAGPAPADTPESLYDEGRKAYRLGDFETAVEKWQRAYDMAEDMQNGAVVAALLLYNISLAYKGLYTITKDIADLRRARAVINNFITIAHANPDVDVDDAEARRDELDEMIRQAEEADAKDEPPPPQVDPRTDDAAIKQVDLGKDPGRKLRLAGIGTMAGGGAILIAGIGLAVGYALESRRVRDQLVIDNERFESGGCDNEVGDPDDGMTTFCESVTARIAHWREVGPKANTLAVALGAGLGGLGAVALIAGGLIFNEGNKRTKQWERATDGARIRLLPAPRGVVLTGRF